MLIGVVGIEYANKIKKCLEEQNHKVVVKKNYEEIKKEIKKKIFDLILINLDLDKEKGIELINNFKKNNLNKIIIALSKDKNKEAELFAFKKGVDDYIKEPVNFDLLCARIEAKLRLTGTNIIEIDELKIDPDEEKVIYKGKEVDLKGKPFEVLTYLAKNRKKIVSKDELLEAIWEEPEMVTPNVIEVAINQIRQRMDKPLGISTIETVRRKGYRFCYHLKRGENGK